MVEAVKEGDGGLTFGIDAVPDVAAGVIVIQMGIVGRLPPLADEDMLIAA